MSQRTVQLLRTDSGHTIRVAADPSCVSFFGLPVGLLQQLSLLSAAVSQGSFSSPSLAISTTSWEFSICTDLLLFTELDSGGTLTFFFSFLPLCSALLINTTHKELDKKLIVSADRQEGIL